MATVENNGLMTYLDGSGNKHLLYPITKGQNVVGAVEDADKLGGRPPEAYSAVNLLDDSYFVDVVNQRGVTSASAWNYLIDRWLSFNYDSSITLDDNGLTLDVGMLVQRVPISKFRHGKEYTTALYYADGTVSVGSGIVDFGYLGQSHDFFHSTDYGCALSVRGTTTYFDFSINKTGKAIIGAALYEGTYTAETLPPYVQRRYAVDLMECQRYYRREKIQCWFQWSWTNSLRVIINYPKMRIDKPTVNLISARFINVDLGKWEQWAWAELTPYFSHVENEIPGSNVFVFQDNSNPFIEKHNYQGEIEYEIISDL